MVNHTLTNKNELKAQKTSSSEATIDLDDTLNLKIKTLINCLKESKEYNDNWFILNGLTPISTHALINAKNKYFKLANIDKHLRLHDFRHSCATWLFSINIPLTTISKILRHANIQETMKTYTHLLKEDYEKQMNYINGVRKK